MSIPKDVVRQLKCCLTDQESHTVLEPILLKCGGNGCKKCVLESVNDMFKCFNCNNLHNKNEFLGSHVNKVTESLIKLYLNQLFDDLKEKMRSVFENLKGCFYFYYNNNCLQLIFYIFLIQNHRRKHD